VIHTLFGINRLLSGILVMTALFSVNLHIMGKSNVPLMSERTIASLAEVWGSRLLGVEMVNVLGWEVATRDLSVLVLSLLVAVFF